MLLHTDRGVLMIAVHSSLDGSKPLGLVLGLKLLLLNLRVFGRLLFTSLLRLIIELSMLRERIVLGRDI